jgi:hypothetical protein
VGGGEWPAFRWRAAPAGWQRPRGSPAARGEGEGEDCGHDVRAEKKTWRGGEKFGWRQTVAPF